jgi:phytoene dehydrogenase-like protein
VDSARQHYDVVVVGAGHNGLTSAAYLARAGLSVLVLERLPHVGGAAVTWQPFAGQPARLSRYSALISGLPDQIVADLGLQIDLAEPATASYTPVVWEGRHTGLIVERPEGPATSASFRVRTGGTEEYDAWQRLAADASGLARAVAPTLLQPLPLERDVRAQVEPRVWEDLVSTPLAKALEARFADDNVRGMVACSALMGSMLWLDDPSLEQNRLFLRHALAGGSAGWRVPVGGMGSVTEALAGAARAAGADVQTSAGVSAIRAGGDGAEITWQDMSGTHTVSCRFALANTAPWVLEILMGAPEDHTTKPIGSQLTIHALVERLPRLRSGLGASVALSGVLRIGQGYEQLRAAYTEAAAGRLPAVIPGELHVPSLTDPSVLGDLASTDAQTVSYFGYFTPPSLFEASREATKAEAVRRAVAAIDEHLEEPLMSCLALDANGAPCLRASIPQELEADLAMPGGHIFHGELDWPWAANRARLDTPAQQWGVQTDQPSVLLCGSGARRGGGVSGIAGHNAAQAVLASL